MHRLLVSVSKAHVRKSLVQKLENCITLADSCRIHVGCTQVESLGTRASACVHSIFLLQDKLLFGYDLERIIDDWILMGFLVGNDFIPHLPNMHISHVSGHLVHMLIPYSFQQGKFT